MSAASGAGGRPGGTKTLRQGRPARGEAETAFTPGRFFVRACGFWGPRRTAPRRRRWEICKIFEDGAD